MYTEQEMQKRIQKVRKDIVLKNGFDILLTHAPVKGYGDMEDLPHQGFQAFDHHQVGTGDGRAGVAAQAHGIGVVVSEDTVFGRAEEVGQCVLDGNGRGIIEE